MSVRTIDSSDFTQLKWYMPIPHGGWKFFAGLMNALVLMVVVSFGIYFVLTADTYLSEEARRAIGIFGGGALLITIPLYFVTGARCNWIESYFTRNVRGYLVRFWMSSDEKVRLWRVYVVPSESDSSLDPSFVRMLGALELEFRLGGWIQFAGTGIRKDSKAITHESLLRNWSVRLHTIHWHTGAVLVELRYTHPSSDGRHERIVLPVDEAIRLLVLANSPGTGVMSISDALLKYKNELEASRKEVESIEGDRLTAVHDLTQALDRLENARQELSGLEDAIRQTTRLKTTIEGKELLVQVLGGLAKLYTDLDERSKSAKRRLTEARDDLDRARTRKRDR
ncbi:hypothetical protein HZA85_01560 [Candidatus Uhrbacteria bacterium]|nr:hypothetical protein [Candidatus Uhrbacteria bacterium]